MSVIILKCQEQLPLGRAYIRQSGEATTSLTGSMFYKVAASPSNLTEHSHKQLRPFVQPTQKRS